jgi:hypothetical protein
LQATVRVYHLAYVSASVFDNHKSWKEEGRDTKIGDGIIQDTSGDVIFNVQFEAIACRPEKDEVLDGKVVDVTHSGI